MTLLDIFKIIKKYAYDIPNVHSVVNEFTDLNREDAKYSAIVIQQREHTRINEDFISYNFYVAYVDRLTDNKLNSIEIQSLGISLLNNLINKINEDYGGYTELSVGQYIVFSQRFTAECSGVYTTLSFNVPIDECIF